jgi:hypothetical protein
VADIDEKTLDKIDARAERAIAVAVDEGWFDDESALDAYAPKAARWAYSDAIDRDPRETADALYIAACDPALVRSLVAEIRRRRAADLTAADREALRRVRHCSREHCTSVDGELESDLAVLDRLIGAKP